LKTHYFFFFGRMSRATAISQLQRSSEDLQELLAWYEIRDMLLGHNWARQDAKKAFKLASVCKHHNAIWLTNLFTGYDVKTEKEAKEVFEMHEESDARALCFSALYRDVDFTRLQRSAELCCAFAQSWMAKNTKGKQKFEWGEKAAAQEERDGFEQLGMCYKYGEGCEANFEKANANFLSAAELGHVESMINLGDPCVETDPRRFFWFGQAAARGDSFDFLQEMEVQMYHFQLWNWTCKYRVCDWSRAKRAY
jgi:hypothetical protein